MKSIRKIAGILTGVLGVVILLGNFITEKILTAKTSVVIGGADGPTSVFVAGKLGGVSIGFIPSWQINAVGIVLLVLSFLVLRKK